MFNLENGNQSFLQEFAGYSLTGFTDHAVALVLYGPDVEGKNVILNVMAALLGEMSSRVKIKDLGKRSTPKLLKGKRINICRESKPNLSDSYLLRSISGKDGSQAKWWISCDELPVGGFSRDNFRLIEFNKKTDPVHAKQITDEIIKSELSGVLNWALRGYHRLQENGDFTR